MGKGRHVGKVTAGPTSEKCSVGVAAPSGSPRTGGLHFRSSSALGQTPDQGSVETPGVLRNMRPTKTRGARSLGLGIRGTPVTMDTRTADKQDNGAVRRCQVPEKKKVARLSGKKKKGEAVERLPGVQVDLWELPKQAVLKGTPQSSGEMEKGPWRFAIGGSLRKRVWVWARSTPGGVGMGDGRDGRKRVRSHAKNLGLVVAQNIGSATPGWTHGTPREGGYQCSGTAWYKLRRKPGPGRSTQSEGVGGGVA